MAILRGVGTECEGYPLSEIDFYPNVIASPTEYITLTSKTPPISWEIFCDIDDAVYSEYVRVFDQSGLLYYRERSNVPDSTNVNPIYRIGYNRCIENPCDEFHLLCGYEYHPGWICAPIQPMDSRFAKMYHKLK